MITPVFSKLQHVITTLLTIPGCKPVSVGGSVRDALLHPGNEDLYNRILDNMESVSKDFDLEVFKATPDQVVQTLANAGIEVELVGRAFPVYKVKGHNIDISFPRLEVKTGDGHADFETTLAPDISFQEAALRRDFTINAIGYDWSTGLFEDPYNGMADLKAKLLKPVSPRFKEDALRVLRAFKFIARLGFRPVTQTLIWCAGMTDTLATYAHERMQPEWNDFLLKGKPENVHAAMDFLIKTYAARTVFPEISDMWFVEQEPRHHPEGTVGLHTCWCLEYFMRVVRSKLANDEERLIVGYAVLTHDFGKFECTVRVPFLPEEQTDPDRDYKITSPKHEDSPRPRKFLERLFDPADPRISDIEDLVKAHMRPTILANDKSGLSAMRRLNVAVKGKMDRLLFLVECDQGGRPGKPVDYDGINWVIAKCSELRLDGTTEIKPIILGRHILKHLGLKSGPAFKPILTDMFECQLEGMFTTEEEGIALLIQRHATVAC